MARLVQTLSVLVLASLGIFVMIRSVPGDPAQVQAGPDASPEQIVATRVELGLDHPWPVQYAVWAKNILTGHLGDSFASRAPVVDLIRDAMPTTLLLLVCGMFLGVMLGVATGALSAIKHGTWIDKALGIVISTVYGMPIFWIGLMMIIVFSLRLGWLPSGGYISPLEDPIESLRSLVMPATVLGLALAVVISRFVRASLLDTLSEDYIRTARSKGLTRGQALRRHALRNALVPAITVIGMQFGELLGGAVVIETVFSIPGMGQLMLTAIGQRDYPTLQAALLLLMGLFALINLATDLSYRLIDPRVGV